MTDIDALCADLNSRLPAAGWSLRRPLKSLMPRHGDRCAAATWDAPGPDGNGLALQIYERERSPVLIVWETDHSAGTAEPHEDSVTAIIEALNEYRWVVSPLHRKGKHRD